MNTTQLKDYAPRARRDFIAAVEAQAARLGITATGVADARVQGDVLLVGGQAFPKGVAEPREKLAARVRAEGFEPTMEAIAYTWFNRFAAMRYMELHGYLEHGFRVLSHPQGQARPEILDHVADVELPGLDRAKVVELKLDGTKDEDLYRLLLTAQCNALHKAMPFLFERIGDETELVLPANLLHTDSLVRQLVEAIDESAWEQIEIIGWLYQFYISEKKEEVIGKVVKSEDIPAATQLFTPNWIVKYLVQNSLGALWLATYPSSPLKGQMEFYIEPAKQTDEVAAKLKDITPSVLDPEVLTLIDPASGSGHILVEAYELFKAIYLERGYRQQDVAQLILEKNLFGLDIDERASQLTGFALMMKGRADDRRLFERGVKCNALALAGSAKFDAERLAHGVRLADYGLQTSDLTGLKGLFEHATTYGSLIQVPGGLAAKLPALRRLSEANSQDIFVADTLKRLGLLVRQAELLGARYDLVVANPPYMGSKGMNALLKAFLQANYDGYEKDVFSAFIDRNLAFSKPCGRLGCMSPMVWMFISSHEHLRRRLIERETITSLVQLEYSGFDGATVPICTFTLQKGHVREQKGCYIRLADFRGADNQAPRTLAAIRDRGCGWFFEAAQDKFKKIPGSPVAYWLGPATFEAFGSAASIGDVAEARIGLATGRNDHYVRQWPEISMRNMCRHAASRADAAESGCRWFPYAKGGEFRRWYGNHHCVLNWENDGAQLQTTMHPDGGRIWAHNFNLEQIFQEAMSWTFVTSGPASFRLQGQGFLFDSASGLCQVKGGTDVLSVLGWLNSKVVMKWLPALNPTLNLPPGAIQALPFPRSVGHGVVRRLLQLAKADWDAYERSWDFQVCPILQASSESTATIECSYSSWIANNREIIAEAKRLEEESNRDCINAYALSGELGPDVPIEQVTLTVNPAYRYGGKLTVEEQWTRFRHDTMREMVSYAIGCMMGRYSLDAPGLIYAHCGNEGFDPSRYTIFRADSDGIVPVTDTEWFDDDVAERVIEFISLAWDSAHLEDNLNFLADNLSRKQNETGRETVRRYLCDSFFKDHLQTYKKRPIYWLFSSGKQKAFQCLVYLHRYNAGTLARMRSEYVIPLQGKMAARLDKLQGDIQVATSTAHQKRLEKERAQLAKQQVELLAFDEKLRHFADRRITLDLDDGVKVNYGKFGDLLAEVKAVTGGAEDE